MKDAASLVEADKYYRVWARDEYRQSPSPGLKILPQALRTLGLIQGTQLNTDHSIADFGCGAGLVVNELHTMGIAAIGVDLSKEGPRSMRGPFLNESLWEMRGLQVDYGLCCDVMEHIPTDKVFQTLVAIGLSVRRACFFQIAMFADHFGPALIDQPLHLTVEGPTWWTKQFTLAGWKVEMVVDKTYGDDYSYLLVHAFPR